jgi:hypothetical protein
MDYVKSFEASGARILPINYNSTQEELMFIMNKINGLFLMGGGA